MSDLIPAITISEFNRLKVPDKKRLKSCEVMADGEYLFTFINPQHENIRNQAEYMALKSNSVGGENIEDILKQGGT